MSTDKWVDSITHLKSQPRPELALEILNRIVSLVKPIMRKHGWRLPVLAEFFPKTPNLLGMNVNAGRKILLRLRQPHSNTTFLDQEEILQTMLHELTHNVHGPHDQKFYKFLGCLQDEYDALQRSGYSGEGFFSKGQRLGMDVSHNAPMHVGRSKALEAAEKRHKTARALGSGGTLGGTSNKNLSPRELAGQAAERRLEDEKRCGGAAATADAEAAAQDSISSIVIDLTLEELTPNKPPLPHAPLTSSSKSSSRPRPSKHVTIDLTRKASRPRPYPAAIITRSNSKQWSCSSCTLLNDDIKLQCEACGSHRPMTVDGWTCLSCAQSGQPADFWTCSSCGTMKSSN